MRICLLLCLSLVLQFAQAQGLLKGTVVDDASGQALAGASVFLSNTSAGTIANSSGNFELYIPAGKYDLIASSVGYETFSGPVNAGALPERLTIRLKQKPRELEQVVVALEKDGWQRWGRFFLESFIGTSVQGLSCRLRNPETLRFFNDKEKGVLTVVAREPLIIENKALGYRIHYQLEEFTYSFRDRYLLYTGFPLFEPMTGSASKQRRWENARASVYAGSLMHFMRSLYRNRLRQDGFRLYRQRKMPNLKEVRSQERLPQGRIYCMKSGARFRCDVPDDTIRAYQEYIGNDEITRFTDNKRLSGDSIAYAGDSTTAVLDFTDYLVVIYDEAQTPAEYRKQVVQGNYAMQSEIVLINGRPVAVEANGAFFNPVDLLTTGWWAWSEKAGTMLPFDYQPPEPKTGQEKR